MRNAVCCARADESRDNTGITAVDNPGNDRWPGESPRFFPGPTGALASATDYAGRTTSYSYYLTGPAARALATVINPDATRLDFVYDQNGRLFQLINNGLPPVSLGYDLGAVSIDNAANRAVSTVFYDEQGRFVKAQDPLLQTTLSRFDAHGNLIGVTAPDGTASSMRYDAKGNPVELADPLRQLVRMSYGTFSRMTALTDPESRTTSFRYDLRGNLTSIVYPDAGSESFSHDTAGNVTRSVSRGGKGIGYSYDASSRIVRKEYDDGSSVQYRYDAFGKLVSVTDPAGATSFMSYDARQQLTRITYPGGRFLAYTYDAAGRRASVTDQLGHQQTYTYTVDGLLESIRESGGGEIVRYSYDDMLRLTGEMRGNGVSTAYQYDLAGRLVAVANYNAAKVLLSLYEYSFDANNRRTGMATLNGAWSYGYDKTGQLTSARFASSTAGIPDKEILYAYDKAGNRVRETVNGAATNYTTNAMNQYTKAGAMTYAYAPNGNLVSRTDGVSTWRYFYDDENRLVAATGPDGDTEYAYDGLGNLTALTENGITKQILTDPAGLGNVVGEYDEAGNLLTRYTHGLGLVAKDGYHYTFDGNGNTSELTDPASHTVNAYGYDPFGQALFRAETVENRFQFVGQLGVQRVANDLLFMRNRFYAPGMGRFLTEDPIGLAGGTNLYSYVLNDPVNFVDPSGLFLGPAFMRGGSKGILSAGPGALAGGIIGTYLGAGLGTATGIPGAGLAGGMAGGILGGKIGGLLDPPCAGQLNCNEPNPPQPAVCH